MRAEMRGDALLKRASASDVRLASRDRCYDAAISYYKFSGARQELSAAGADASQKIVGPGKAS